MRIQLELFTLGIALSLTPFWTAWYLPINFTIAGYYGKREANLSILWFIHLGIRFPWKKTNIDAKEFLPRHHQ